MRNDFDYYYSEESEQFTFYRIPKSLFTRSIFSGLSTDSKVLYGLLLDRMGLSLKNGWFDEQNRVFVNFSIDEACTMLGYQNKKVVRIFNELADIGLIEKKRVGLGQPNRLYIKNFQKYTSVETFQEVSNEHFQKCQNDISGNVKETFQEVSKQHFRKCQNDISRSDDLTNQEMSNRHSNYIKDNKTKDNNSLINQSQNQNQPETYPVQSRSQAEAYRVYGEVIRENIDYDSLASYNPNGIAQLDEITNLIIDTICSGQKTFRINKENLQAEIVKKRFLQLKSYHIERVIEKLGKAAKVTNVRNYILTALYNSVTTASFEYQTDYNTSRI